MPDTPVPFIITKQGDQFVVNLTDPQPGRTYRVKYLNGTWTVTDAGPVKGRGACPVCGFIAATRYGKVCAHQDRRLDKAARKGTVSCAGSGMEPAGDTDA